MNSSIQRIRVSCVFLVALAFALSPTAQGQLPLKPAPQGMYIFSTGYLSSSNQAASAAGPSINNANCDGVRWQRKMVGHRSNSR